MNKLSIQKGDILVSVLVFAAVAVTVIIGLTNWGAAMITGIRTEAAKEQALQIAEAGVDYYQWHLAQSPNDYKDGTTTPSPYVHKFYNRDGDLLGTYSLTITPPPVGSTIVKILSVGKLASSTISRQIQESLAIPSLAKFAVIAKDNMNFGSGTTVNGPIQSNGGIHFDGVAHNLVASAMTTYTDPDSGQNEWGVYTTSGTDDPQPNTPVNNRPDVFISGRQFPVPAFDFTGLTAGLTQLQTLAQQGGKEWTNSGADGYHIVFKVVNGVTSYDLYKVTALASSPSSNCTNDQSQSINQGDWGTWSIKSPISSNQTPVNTSGSNNYPIPSNGVIFFDDDVWVDGTINNARVTVVAGVIGATSNYPAININTNLKYTNYNGNDVIGLIAQGNINSGLISDDNYEIDAALVAENGRVGRYYYSNNCTLTDPNYPGSSSNQYYYKRSSITLLGMIATAIRYGFAYSDYTGYLTRNIIYDGNLLYAPPPSFPQATNQYQVISWQQLQ